MEKAKRAFKKFKFVSETSKSRMFYLAADIIIKSYLC